MPRLVAFEARRALPLVVLLAVAAAVILSTGSTRTTNVSLWGDLTHAVLYSYSLAGPIIAAAAAWSAGREHRARLEELLASVPRSRAARQAAQALALTVTSWGGLVLGVVIASVPLWFGAAVGRPDLTELLLALPAVLPFIGIGFLLAALTRGHAAAAPLAAGVTYFGQYLLLRSAGLTWLTPVSERLSVLQPYPGGVASRQALWFVGIGLGCLALSARASRATWRHLAISTAPLAIAGACAASLVGAPDTPPRVAPDICGRGEPVVCVDPRFAVLLPDLQAGFQRALVPLVVAGVAPERMVQSAQDMRSGGPEWRFVLARMDNRLDPDFIISLNLASWLSSPGCMRATVEEQAASQTVVAALLEKAEIPAFGVPPQVQSRAQRLARLDSDQLASWLRSHWSDIRDCSLRPAV